jgi:hypothetical protein
MDLCNDNFDHGSPIRSPKITGDPDLQRRGPRFESRTKYSPARLQYLFRCLILMCFDF